MGKPLQYLEICSQELKLVLWQKLGCSTMTKKPEPRYIL